MTPATEPAHNWAAWILGAALAMGAFLVACWIKGVVMSAITIPANTLEAGDTVRMTGVVRVEAEPHLTVDFERFMGTERLEQIKTAIDHARARHERRMRKPLLSGRYGKRKRQRAQGVARVRHMRREHSQHSRMTYQEE